MTPSSVKSGSTPRSKRYLASELIFIARPALAIVIGSQYALSNNTLTVSSEQPVELPPIIPAILIMPDWSEIFIAPFGKL